MMALPFSCGKFSKCALLSLVALLTGSPALILGANTISGTVRNLSRGLPAAHDVVILFRIEKGVQEESRAKSDSQGRFTLVVRYPQTSHLVRVIHQGVTYDQAATAGGDISIQVFDASSQVRGITTNIEVLRAGTNGNLLHVSDLVELRNESSPPLTKTGDRNFDVYLLSEARIDSVLAAGPNEVGAAIPAVPVPGEPGHFTVSFPLRPGATKFAFNYDIPYDGSAAFQTKHAYPLHRFAVMLPPSMKFSSTSTAFKTLAIDDGRYQVQEATLPLDSTEGPGFNISGSGPPPLVADNPISDIPLRVPGSLVADRAKSSSLSNTNSRPYQAQSSSQSGVLSGVTAILLVSCALLIWRARKAQSISSKVPVPQGLLFASAQGTNRYRVSFLCGTRE